MSLAERLERLKKKLPAPETRYVATIGNETSYGETVEANGEHWVASIDAQGQVSVKKVRSRIAFEE